MPAATVPMRLGEGAVLLQGYLSPAEQIALAEQCLLLIDGEVPGYVPVVRGAAGRAIQVRRRGRLIWRL